MVVLRLSPCLVGVILALVRAVLPQSNAGVQPDPSSAYIPNGGARPTATGSESTRALASGAAVPTAALAFLPRKI